MAETIRDKNEDKKTKVKTPGEAVVMEIFNLRHLEWFQLARTDLDKPRLSAAQRSHGGEKIKISKTI